MACIESADAAKASAGVSAGKAKGRMGSPPKTCGERQVHRCTWSCLVRCDAAALSVAAVLCDGIRKFAIRPAAEADGAPAVEAFFGLAADKSVKQLAAALVGVLSTASGVASAAEAVAAAVWSERAGSEGLA